MKFISSIGNWIKKHLVVGIAIGTIVVVGIVVLFVPYMFSKTNIRSGNNDKKPPTVGALKANYITETTVTLLADEASSEIVLHREAYSFKCGDGTYSSWQKDNYMICSGLSANTEYTFSAKVRDAAGNETEFASITATTTSPVTTHIANGTIVYFNPETGLKCDDYVEENSTTGNKAGCMKWYAFNPVLDSSDVEDSTKVNLLLDHNTTETTTWSPRNQISRDEIVEGDSAHYQLNSDTYKWNEFVKTTARLITANEIAKITEQPNFNALISQDSSESPDPYFFETNGLCGDCSTLGKEFGRCECANIGKGNAKYGWLYDRLTTCDSYGCINSDIGEETLSYWTDNQVKGVTNQAWIVTYEGELSWSNIGGGLGAPGIRPVITVSKSKIVQ